MDPRGGVDTNALTSAAIVPESTMRFTHPRRTNPSGSPPQLCRGDLAFETPQEASHGSPALTRASRAARLHALLERRVGSLDHAPFPVRGLPESARLSAFRPRVPAHWLQRAGLEGQAFPKHLEHGYASDALGSARLISPTCASRRPKAARIFGSSRGACRPHRLTLPHRQVCSLWLPAVRSRGAVVCRAGTSSVSST